MTVFSKTYSKIIGTGSYLPEKRVTNQDLTEQLAAKAGDSYVSVQRMLQALALAGGLGLTQRLAL